MPECRREILIVDPAAHTPETDCFNHIARLSPLQASYHLPGICGLGTLHRATANHQAGHAQIAGIVILGSATSVHDRFPWQAGLVDWLRPHMAAGIPVFGFCFGHQMIADMHGGKVDFVREDQEKLKGFHQVAIKKSRLFSAGLRSLLRSHREAVTTTPAGFHIMASSPEVAIDGLEHDTLPVWSLQTHPEATSIFISNQGITGYEDPESLLPEESHLTKDGWTLVRTFLGHCAGR
ncbi:MAG: class glutamine amidotransferase [Pseudomonadota bacterium]|jgi:GMP synthase-like glutamine amidotransferase